MAESSIPPEAPPRHSFALCFDGTGNEFKGDSSDSNVLRIFRLLDRSSPLQYSWYNPGLGTYIQSGSVDQVSIGAKVRSWWVKTSDLAFGSNVGDHVMAGYKFLMRYYTAGDDIYLFGFSRGAYTARFLAEMLDHIGLLSSGNEDLESFAWKCFSGWQARKGGKSEKERAKILELYEFMKAFRETFCRPVKRVRFLGLFDTVNSVPRFENAWLGRSGFPYSARTSAKVIRHAVSIDERRAKFRVDLISDKTRQEEDNEDPKQTRKFHRYMSDLPTKLSPEVVEQPESPRLPDLLDWVRSGLLHSRRSSNEGARREEEPEQQDNKGGQEPAEITQPLSVDPAEAHIDQGKDGQDSAANNGALQDESKDDDDDDDDDDSQPKYLRRRFSDVRGEQDILEVWFAGNHGDVGGGWRKKDSETWPLAHQPLVWMVNEAHKAGLRFDPEKMAGLNVATEKLYERTRPSAGLVGRFNISLEESAKSGFMHDCLEYNKGASRSSVAGWQLLEYLPFKRMDLQSDGSWKAIRWPLPRGETRDVPKDAKIHRSVIDRLNFDQTYRPGNLIMLGLGGRGQRKALEHLGKGEWMTWKNKGDKVAEILIAKAYADEIGHKEEEVHHGLHLGAGWWPRKRKTASSGH